MAGLVARPADGPTEKMALRLAIVEAAAVFAAVWVAALSEPGASWLSRAGVAWYAVILAVCSVTALHHCDLYELETARRFSRSAPRVALAMAAVVAVLGAAQGLPPLAPAPLAGGLLAALALVLALRAALSGWMARRKPVERVLVVGGGALAEQLVEAIESRPDRAQHVLGLVDEGCAAA